ncbi:hypothetical protein HRI_004601600 [Hibiscus trionum]|uniref:RNase H type-1 domain-containing protein n=1 Tax=Hibiscus trionum TaxID=183268 RepID=A0A9W7MP03_HIBTR|nr:hypothetical protein HRI_004601600 [Hibiscus trionum]
MASWSKCKAPNSSLSTEALTADPSLLEGVLWSKVVKKPPPTWSPPPVGFLKLNSDGVASTDGKMGIGGVIRNPDGCSLISFSEHGGYGPPALAELLAIKKGVDIFLESRWATKHRLVIESDCKNVIEWIKGEATRPQAFASLVSDICLKIERFGMVLRLIPRAVNLTADSLAKAGIE